MPTQAEIDAKITKLETNMDRFDGIVNGPEGHFEPTDGGSVPSVAEFYSQVEDQVAGITSVVTTARDQAVAAAGTATTAAGTATTQATAAAGSATTASNAATAAQGFRDEAQDARDEAIAALSQRQGHSVDSFSIGTGSKSFDIETGKVFLPGTDVRVFHTSDPSKYMVGLVDSYDPGTGAMVFTSIKTSGTGTFDEWTVVETTAQFLFRGDWEGTPTTYYIGNLVTYVTGGLASTWQALRNNTNVTPVEGPDWTLFLPGSSVGDRQVTEIKLSLRVGAKVGTHITSDAALASNTDLTYSIMSVGDIILVGRKRYEVLASGATNHTLQTAGGLKVLFKPYIGDDLGGHFSKETLRNNFGVPSLRDTPVPGTKLPRRKVYPDAASDENLAYVMPSLYQWQDGGGVPRMTAAWVASRMDDLAAAGVTDYIDMYVEFRGYWMYQPSFAYPMDYDTGANGQFWHDKITALYDPVLHPYPPANFEPIDFLEVRLKRCDELGIDYWFGLSRQGDTPLVQDLYDVNVMGVADPMRYGLSLGTRVSNAVNRTQQLAADLWLKYGHHPSFAGFKLGHEMSHIPSANNYVVPVITVAGTYPALNSYKQFGVRTMIVPGKLLEMVGSPAAPFDIVGSTNVAACVATQADVFTWQNAAGPGLNYATNNYTSMPHVAFSETPGYNIQRYSAKIESLIKQVNSYANALGRRVENWSICEQWRMGYRPTGTLSIGTGWNTVLATPTFTATGQFAGAQVGNTITSMDGYAVITNVAGAPDSVVAQVLRAFEANSFSNAGVDPLWAWSPGYTGAFPTTANEYKREIPVCSVMWERTVIYSQNYWGNPAATLRAPVSWGLRSDYRTRAEGLHNAILDWKKEQLDRFSGWMDRHLVSEDEFMVSGLSGATITQYMGTFSPKMKGTMLRVEMTIGFGKAPFPAQSGAAGNLTLRLQMNGVTQKSRTIYDNDGWMGGEETLIMPVFYPEGGLAQGVGMELVATAGLSSVSCYCKVQEFMRP